MKIINQLIYNYHFMKIDTKELNIPMAEKSPPNTASSSTIKK